MKQGEFQTPLFGHMAYQSAICMGASTIQKERKDMKVSKAIGIIGRIAAVTGAVGGVAYLGQKSVKREAELHKRYKSYYTTTNQWLTNKNQNKDISVYFKDHNIKIIAIYGMGTMGELFYEDIKKTQVKVSYFIDRNAEEIYSGLDNIPVVSIEHMDDQDSVDAIIVTPVFDFNEIRTDLEKNGIDKEIISLEDVIFEF